MFGVGISLPQWPNSENPESSATMNRMFGPLGNGPTEAPRAACRCTSWVAQLESVIQPRRASTLFTAAFEQEPGEDAKGFRLGTCRRRISRYITEPGSTSRITRIVWVVRNSMSARRCMQASKAASVKHLIRQWTR